MNRFLRTAMATIVAVMAGSIPAWAQTSIPNQTLNAQFTTAPITINGRGSEPAWNTAVLAPITIKQNSGGTAPDPACGVSGTVRALWDGNLLYILVKVVDPQVTKNT